MKYWVLIASLLVATTAAAGDIYVVQGFARGAGLDGELLRWSTDALFYNSGATDATVQFLGTSNGPAAPSTTTFTIPAGTSAALMKIAPSWQPGTFDPLWVIHLTVPDDVAIESVLFIGSETAPAGAPPVVRPQRFGKVRLPVARTLTPANQQQVHLAAWLGDPTEIPSRINVGIYNASATTATAHVQVRQACDERVIDERTLSIPPNTLVQTTGMRALPSACPAYVPGTIGGIPNDIYTIVTVDQPSITFVSNLANTTIPTTSISIN